MTDELPGAGGQPVQEQGAACYWCGKPVEAHENGICVECYMEEGRADEMRVVWREWDRDGK